MIDVALQNNQNVCSTILKYAVSILGTRTCSSQSPERFPKMAPEPVWAPDPVVCDISFIFAF